MENITLTIAQQKTLNKILVCDNKNILIIGRCRVGKKFLSKYISNVLKLDFNIRTSNMNESINGFETVYFES